MAWIRKGRDFVLFYLRLSYFHNCEREFFIAVCLNIQPAKNFKDEVHY